MEVIPTPFPIAASEPNAERTIREKIYHVLEEDLAEMGEPEMGDAHFSKVFWLLDVQLPSSSSSSVGAGAWTGEEAHAMLSTCQNMTNLPLKAYGKAIQTEMYHLIHVDEEEEDGDDDEEDDDEEEEEEDEEETDKEMTTDGHDCGGCCGSHAHDDEEEEEEEDDFTFDQFVIGVPILSSASSHSARPLQPELMTADDLRTAFTTIKNLLKASNATVRHRTPPAEAAARALGMAELLPFFEFDPTISLQFTSGSCTQDVIYDALLSAGFQYTKQAPEKADDGEETAAAAAMHGDMDDEAEEDFQEPGYVYLFPTQLQDHLDVMEEGTEELLQEGSVSATGASSSASADASKKAANDDEDMIEDIDLSETLEATDILHCHVNEAADGDVVESLKLSFPFPHASLPFCALTAMQEVTDYLLQRLAAYTPVVYMPPTSLPEELLRLIGSRPPTKLNAKQRQKARRRAEKAAAAAAAGDGNETAVAEAVSAAVPSQDDSWREELKIVKWKIAGCLKMMREKGGFTGGGDEELCDIL